MQNQSGTAVQFLKLKSRSHLVGWDLMALLTQKRSNLFFKVSDLCLQKGQVAAVPVIRFSSGVHFFNFKSQISATTSYSRYKLLCYIS